jgi:imidazolonepropionase-like amidohydrolase
MTGAQGHGGTGAQGHGGTGAPVVLVVGLAIALAVPLAAQQQAGAPPAPTPVVAIRNATIVPVVGPRVPNGTLVMRGGRIEAVGAGVAVPADALVIDGTGLVVYPGLIDSGTRLGLTEIGSVPGGEDTQELGAFNPHDDALTAVNPSSEIIPTVRVNGVTTALTSARGGVISGQAALVDLAGWTPQEMAILPRAGMVITFPRVRAGRRYGGGGGGQGGEAQAEEVNRQTRALREYLASAKAYSDIKERLAGGAPGTQETDLPMEAMVAVIRGESPVIFEVETAEQIRGALAIADSFQLKIILRGARFAWQLADTLAARRIPVIVGPTVAAPDDRDPYDAIYAYPGVLARAGVKIAFQTDNASDSRNLAYNAGIATAFGLDPDEALRAITINAAQIWGVADRYGSLEAGKIGNVIVTTGDVLDARTAIRYVFIRGQLQNQDDRNTRLYNQFRARPR